MGNDPFNEVNILCVCLMRSVMTDEVEGNLVVYVYNIKAYAISQENNSRGLIITLKCVFLHIFISHMVVVLYI